MWHFNGKGWILSSRMWDKQGRKVQEGQRTKEQGQRWLSQIQVIHGAVPGVTLGGSGAQPASVWSKLSAASEVHLQYALRQQYQSLTVWERLEQWQPMRPRDSAALPTQSKDCSSSGSSLFLSMPKPANMSQSLSRFAGTPSTFPSTDHLDNLLALALCLDMICLFPSFGKFVYTW